MKNTMKNTIIILAILLLCAFSSSAQTKAKINPVGLWKFEIPTQEGPKRGNIAISLSDQKYNAAMSLDESESQIPGEKVSYSGDSFTFQVTFRGEIINFVMKMESDSIMSGTAIHSEGEIPLTAKRKESPAAIQ